MAKISSTNTEKLLHLNKQESIIVEILILSI